MVQVHGAHGKIRYHHEGGGPEIPVADTVAAPIAFGDFKLVGDLAENDTGAITVSKANGVTRLSNNNEDGKGAAIATEVNFSPVLNGTIVIEARVEMAALTARVVFIGLCGTIADDVAEPSTGSTATLTLTAANQAGFFFDSQLTDTDWHCIFNGGSTTGITASGSVDSGVAPVAAEMDILKLVAFPNGTVEWWINGNLVQRTEGAISTTALQGALCGVWGTTTTAADLDVDYFSVEANRDWTR